jgi:hypothetical protein
VAVPITPRGIRNRNPGNIRYVEGVTSTYIGCVGSDGSFCIFDTDEHGIRALAKLLLIYQDKHGLRTVRGIIDRWAPPVENDTSAYVTQVAKHISRAPDETLDLHDADTLTALTTAIIKHENGQQPYGALVIHAAVLAALGRAAEGTQPPAPIEDRSTQLPEQPMPAVSLIASLLPALLEAFSPLAKEKLGKAVGSPEVGAKLVDTLMATATEATGKADPVAAVAAVRADPVIAKQVEVSALAHLAEAAPYLDRIAALEAAERAADEESKDAASKRAQSDGFDMALPLLYGSMGGVGFLLLIISAVLVAQLYKDEPVSTEVWAAFTGIIGWLTAKAGTIFDYRFGTSRTSAAKDIVISEMARGK